ncbi:MAG: MFS transporter, partial [Actinomycetota bacterium]|nr:MFS transporter [Actinomycetota bacterium]
MTARNRLFAAMTVGFVLLGMPMAAMGVAWPSAADDLGRTLGELGLVTFAYGVGYTLSTLASGDLTRRFTIGPLLVAAALAAAGSLAALGLTSTWTVFLAATLLVGVAGGLLDSSVNAYVAVHRGARSMGIIHMGFGIGSAAGPLFVTFLLTSGASWRIAFASLGVAELLLAAALAATVSALDPAKRRTERRPFVDGKGGVLALSLAVFFLYAGVAAGTG